MDILVRCWNYLGSLTRYSSLQPIVFCLWTNSLNKMMKFAEARMFFTEMNHSRDWFCRSVEVGIGWIISLCQLETFPGNWSGCARHDQMLLRFALHEYRGAGCCFERDAWTSLRGGGTIFEDAIYSQFFGGGETRLLKELASLTIEILLWS